MGEFKPYQMVTIRVRHPESSGPQVAGRLGQGVCHGQGRARDFEQNLRGKRQRAANRDHRPAGGDVQRGGKLQ